ncbi:MAG: sulfatase-like hydrolase/transferase [Verrucomicrobia bacterium]|nr:sulfatase-like hydrolase/transferase [Verrucomicrobiota bacterium]
MRELFLSILVGLIFSTGALGNSASAAEKLSSTRPNILFLFTDDQRADTIRALGNPHIKTPNLDSLVKSGFVFRNAYCLGGNIGAVCTPSRNMLLSGRAYFRWKGNLASGNDPNFPVSMNQAGYATYHHGKRGNTALEIQARFQHNQYINETKERVSGQPGKAIVDAAIEFLRTKKDERPFFMYLAFEAPHDPRVAAKEYLDLYERAKIPLPKNYLPQHPFNNGEQVIRDEMLAPWPRTPDEIRRHLHEYYAVISGLDHHIGRLLQCLKDLGQYDNTIIIFSSDHGLAIGSHGLMGKQNIYEAGMKAPLIFTGPGIRKGRSDALVYLLDIFPTVCHLAGAPIPPGLDGQSLKPVLDGKSRGVRDTLFLSYRDVQRAIRDERWKLIRYPQINRTQLFDLRRDPDEIHDLATEASQARRIERMIAALREWQDKLGDAAPLASANPSDPTFTPPSEEELEKLRPKRKM